MKEVVKVCAMQSYDVKGFVVLLMTIPTDKVVAIASAADIIGLTRMNGRH